MISWTVVQHVPWEGPGTISAEAAKRRMPIDVLHVDQAASLPKAGGIEGLIVMGGPMGVYESQKHPILSAECRLIAEVVRQGTPVLGVCLGAQLLAHALGASVFRGHQPEVGFGFVDLTAAGQRDPIFDGLGTPLPVFHWHGDTFDLPRGATLLASNANYLHQAFRFGNCAYGLQFHVEPDSRTWAEWQMHLPAPVFEGMDQKREQILEVGQAMIVNFFDLALKQPRNQAVT